jgi:hypothetical protein
MDLEDDVFLRFILMCVCKKEDYIKVSKNQFLNDSFIRFGLLVQRKHFSLRFRQADQHLDLGLFAMSFCTTSF